MLYLLQVEALFELIKGLIKDMDEILEDEVVPCYSHCFLNMNYLGFSDWVC